MNIENLNKVIAGIRAHSVPDLGFNMSSWSSDQGGQYPDNDGDNHVCGTTACGAGWTVAIFDGFKEMERVSNVTVEGIEDGHKFYENGCFMRAKEILGINSQQADQLFTDQTNGDETSEDFIAACEHLRDHGSVAWPTLNNRGRNDDESDD